MASAWGRVAIPAYPASFGIGCTERSGPGFRYGVARITCRPPTSALRIGGAKARPARRLSRKRVKICLPAVFARSTWGRQHGSLSALASAALFFAEPFFFESPRLFSLPFRSSAHRRPDRPGHHRANQYDSDLCSDRGVKTRGQDIGQHGQVPNPGECLISVGEFHQVEIGIGRHDVACLTANPSAHVDIAISPTREAGIHCQAYAGIAGAACTTSPTSYVERHRDDVAHLKEMSAINGCDIPAPAPWAST